MNPRRHLLLALAPAAFALPSLANSPQVTAPTSSVSAGVEISNNGSRRVDIAGSTRFLDGWGASAGVARADVDLPGTTTQSTVAGAILTYDFGRFGVGGGFRRSEIDGVSRSRDWLARAFVQHEDMRFELEIGHRESELAPSPFTEDIGGGTGIVSGTSRCSVDGLGYKGQVDLDRPTWSAYASLRVFDYDDFDCALEITAGGGPPGNGPPPHARGRALGRRLAATPLETAVGATSRLVPSEASLLRSSAYLGFRTPITLRWMGGVDLYRDVEKLDGSDYLTGIVSASRQLDAVWTLELSLGYSAADVIDDTAFAGVRVTAAF